MWITAVAFITEVECVTSVIESENAIDVQINSLTNIDVQINSLTDSIPKKGYYLSD